MLRVQQQLNVMTEKVTLYKNRLSSLKEEMSNGENGRLSRLPKCPEFYELQERVRMLEEEIVAERNAHTVTKNMLKQETENRAAHFCIPLLI